MKKSLVRCASMSCLPDRSTLHPSPSALGTEADPFSLHGAGAGAPMAFAAPVSIPSSRRPGRGRRRSALGYLSPQILPCGSEQTGCAPQLWGPAPVLRPPLVPVTRLFLPLGPLGVAGLGEVHHPCGLPTGAHICVNRPLIKFSDYPFSKCHLFPARNLADIRVVNSKSLTQC